MTDELATDPCGCGGAKCVLSRRDERHGTASAYNTRGCRCVRCRRAWADYQRSWSNANPERAARLRKQRQQRYRARQRQAVAA